MPQLEIQKVAMGLCELSNSRFNALMIAKVKTTENKFLLGLTAFVKCQCG